MQHKFVKLWHLIIFITLLMTSIISKRSDRRKWSYIFLPISLFRKPTSDQIDKLNLIAALEFMFPESCQDIADASKLSTSQRGQDIAALLVSGFKSEGFFVEIGVGDGIGFSNTFLLEKHFSWKGILVEPARSFESLILQNRTSSLETAAAYERDGLVLNFTEETDALFSHLGRDQHNKRTDNQYPVNTLSLDSILLKHGAPQSIDFLSLDVEGAEEFVLRGLDLNNISIGFLCIEVNNEFAKTRRIKKYLGKFGYKQIYCHISSFDAWFVSRERRQKLGW